jgi:pyrethroid hydrolase
VSCPFEIKYISVTWSDKKSIRSITESRFTLPIIEVSSTEYEVDAITYSKIDDTRKYGQIAFHIAGHLDGDSSPEIISGENKKPLFKIVDEDTKKVWWIEDGDWEKKKNQSTGETFVYKDSPMCRYAGKVEVIYEGVQCSIKIRSSSFTYEELDRYFDDFKSGLWGLILDDKSYVTAERSKPSRKIDSEDLLTLSNQLINYSENILQTPKKELRESQSVQHADKVRPNSRTFRDIALKSLSAKELTGRDYAESYDVSENQYAFGCVVRTYTIVANLLNACGKQNEYIGKEYNRSKKRLDGFVDTIKIDKDLTLKELSRLQDKIEKELNNLKKVLDEQEPVEGYPSYKPGFVKIKSKGQVFKGRESFWGTCKSREQDEWIDKLFSFRFDPEFSKALNINGSYRFSAYTERFSGKKTKAGKQFTEINFKSIESAEIIESGLESALLKLKHELERLEKSNWTRLLSPAERKEQDREKIIIQKNLQQLLDIKKKNEESNRRFSPILSRLHKQKKKYKNKKIKDKYNFPGSMTFVQNKNYQGLHRSYKKIKNSLELDDGQLAYLKEFDSIAILNISRIYERWCLLQIIKILIDKLLFTPENGWKKKLLQQILQTKKNISLVFENKNIKRKITLHYEKELPSKRRPDFVLDVESPICSKYKRFVMDAKFYEEINISEVVDQLYNKKNYSEDSRNMVFILHPSSSAIVDHATPLPWGNHSYYGEAAMFDWQEYNVLPDHKYGSIFLSPIDDAGSNDNLQRLLGMFLQYGLEENNHNLRRDEDRKIDPFLEKELFCIKCGSEKKDVERKKTIKGYRYEITCKDCSHVTEYNYCWNCKNRLIKNGIYWTYHATHPLSPYDIRCPYCSVDLQDFSN